MVAENAELDEVAPHAGHFRRSDGTGIDGYVCMSATSPPTDPSGQGPWRPNPLVSKVILSEFAVNGQVHAVTPRAPASFWSRFAAPIRHPILAPDHMLPEAGFEVRRVCAASVSSRAGARIVAHANFVAFQKNSNTRTFR